MKKIICIVNLIMFAILLNVQSLNVDNYYVNFMKLSRDVNLINMNEMNGYEDNTIIVYNDNDKFYCYDKEINKTYIYKLYENNKIYQEEPSRMSINNFPNQITMFSTIYIIFIFLQYFFLSKTKMNSETIQNIVVFNVCVFFLTLTPDYVIKSGISSILFLCIICYYLYVTIICFKGV
jgi:hypothetical protein